MPKREIKKIYFVDDSDDEIFMAKIFFKRQNIGPEFQAFTSLEELYDFLNNDPSFDPDTSICVLDMNLTMSKGTEGVTHIRASKIGQQLMLGISTGSEDPADRLSAKEAGADFFVGKPLDRATIEAICDSVPKLSRTGNEDEVLKIYRAI